MFRFVFSFLWHVICVRSCLSDLGCFVCLIKRHVKDTYDAITCSHLSISISPLSQTTEKKVTAVNHSPDTASGCRGKNMRYLKAKVPRILISVKLMSPVVRSGCECSKSLALPGVGKKKKKQPLQSARQTMSVDTEKAAQTVGEG